MREIKFLFIAMFGLSILFAAGCGKKNKNEPVEMSINIYLVAPESSNLNGKSFGCGDILVPVTKTILVEKNEVESVMIELFAMKNNGELTNYIKGPGLFFYQATVSNGKAEIYIKGDFFMSTACDIPRIREQLTETSKQFSDIREVKIFINAQSLEEYLSTAQQGFN
jgi:hypothetical protein